MKQMTTCSLLKISVVSSTMMLKKGADRMGSVTCLKTFNAMTINNSPHYSLLPIVSLRKMYSKGLMCFIWEAG